MIIKTAQYYKDRNDKNIGIKYTTDRVGAEHSVLLNSNDTPEYIEIMKMVEAGTLTIKEAD